MAGPYTAWDINVTATNKDVGLASSTQGMVVVLSGEYKSNVFPAN